MKKLLRSIGKVLCVLPCFYAGAAASETEEGGNEFFTFTFENDVFIGEDDGYMNGTGITFGTAGSRTEISNEREKYGVLSVTYRYKRVVVGLAAASGWRTCVVSYIDYSYCLTRTRRTLSHLG